jgi:hypothetical protein
MKLLFNKIIYALTHLLFASTNIIIFIKLIEKQKHRIIFYFKIKKFIKKNIKLINKIKKNNYLIIITAYKTNFY